ncbi:MAG: methyltransferase domain-containing protein [Chlamydiales bacterium]|nr:methyltransferase domain-containing protein [Chlamydiales bacterium]
MQIDNPEIAVIWNAQEYAEHSTVQAEAARALLEKIQFRGNEKVIDIGCGDGKLSACISKKVPLGKVLGVDISKDMIKHAQRTFPNDEYENLTFISEDAENLNAQNEFDILFSSFALQWLSDKPAFFKKAYNALTESSLLVLTIPLDVSPPLEKALEEVTVTSKWKEFFFDYSPYERLRPASEYRAYIEHCGFVLTSFSTETQKKIFASTQLLKDYIRQWLIHLNHLPNSLRESFFEEVMEQYFLHQPPAEDGSILFEFQRVDIIAQKSSLESCNMQIKK